jgi:glycerol-3-phosphate O-acyltransferase
MQKATPARHAAAKAAAAPRVPIVATRRAPRASAPIVRASAAPAAPASSSTAAAVAPASSYAGRTRAAFLSSLQHINPAFSAIASEAQFMGLLEKLSAAGKLPQPLLESWRDFYASYRGAVVGSGAPGASEELAARVQATIADTVFNQMAGGDRTYEFPSAHRRLLDPYDYYEFGQRYVGSLIDFESSVLGRPDRWQRVADQLKNGDNVVLLANHQTEADPGVFAHMLAASHPEMAEEVNYVAGDRVVTDPLCKPFSMGRNLFCVHSKRHMGDDPVIKASKMDTNRKTLVAMQRALNAGGCLLWIAPAGGRDRPHPETGAWLPDKWDPAAVELMRNLVARAKAPGHIYPMAMFSWPVMPPPKAVEKNLGERRVTAYSGVGISLCDELTEAELAAPAKDAPAEAKEAAQRRVAELAQRRVTDEYRLLERAIVDPAVRAAEPAVWAQPFLQA